MTDLYSLPVTATIRDRTYSIHADFRDVLEILAVLEDPSLPEYIRWRIALALFYEEELPRQDWEEGCRFLTDFVENGRRDARPGPKLLDWEQDAAAIIADVNKAAGQEVRSLPFVHWWTFLSWFNAIGEGQLSTLVSIRDKLRRGKKLEDWEKEYYRQNKDRVDLKKRYSDEELAEQERLNKLLRA